MVDTSKLNELFPHLQLKKLVECVCTHTYVFNNTVTFHKGETYPVELKTREDSDLLAVIQPDERAYVGMSESRFAEYFQMKDIELDMEEEYEQNYE